MTNVLQTTLEALQAQLQTKQKEVDECYDLFKKSQIPSIENMVMLCLKSLGISEDCKIAFGGDNMAIYPTSDEANCVYSSDGIQVYYRVPYTYDETGKRQIGPGKIKLNWYGSSCEVEDTKTLKYLTTLGRLADKISVIEKQYQNWYSLYMTYESPLNDVRSEIFPIERAIRDTKQKIKYHEIENVYKKPMDFFYKLSTYKRCVRDYDAEGVDAMKMIEGYGGSIELKYGRSKFDCYSVTSFKILEVNKYKAKLEVITSSHKQDKIYEVEVSAKNFDTFICNVYNYEVVDVLEFNKIADQKYINTQKSK
jgi:hypothetical protein